LRRLLVASLLANVIGAAGLVLLAGRPWPPIATPAPPPSAYDRATPGSHRFDGMPVSPGDVVFVGDSHVDYGLWTEFFGTNRVRSRGQEGEGVFGVRHWIGPILDGGPSLVVLWVGGNDLYNGIPLERVEEALGALVDEARGRAQGTEVVLLSGLPMTKNHVLHGIENARADSLNAALGRVARSTGVRFVDLRPRLTDEDGSLDLDVSFDGSHLNGDGYSRVIEVLHPFVNGALAGHNHPPQRPDS
jgi:lysophospholipase L1-like esterase